MKQQLDLRQFTPEALAKRRAILTARLTLMMGVAIAFVTLLRPLMSTLPAFFIVSGVINSCLFLGLWWLLKKGYWQRQAPVLLMALSFLVALPMVALSGGPNSQYSPIIPLFPFIGLLSGRLHLAVFTLIFWTVAWILLAWLLLNGFLPGDLSASPVHPGKTVSRTIWIIVATTVALVFTILFDNRSRELREYLLQLVETDPLTGVGNRRCMDMSMERELTDPARQNDWLTLILIDVDHFKRYNDLRGHAQGDIALRKIADCLRRCLDDAISHGNATVARYGGEEFVIILHNADPADAGLMCEKIRQEVLAQTLFYQNDKTDVVSITIGFASIRHRQPDSAQALFEQADAALYYGKTHGRNCVVDAKRI